MVQATLGAIEVDHNERWLHVVGKGGRARRVTLPPLARAALDHYLVQRSLPTTPQKWDQDTPLVGTIGGETRHPAGAPVGRDETLLRDRR